MFNEFKFFGTHTIIERLVNSSLAFLWIFHSINEIVSFEMSLLGLTQIHIPRLITKTDPSPKE